jgi:hypothetical protein
MNKHIKIYEDFLNENSIPDQLKAYFDQKGYRYQKKGEDYVISNSSLEADERSDDGAQEKIAILNKIKSAGGQARMDGAHKHQVYFNFGVHESTVNESVYSEYVKKVGPALTKFLKEKGLNWPTTLKATEQRGSIQIESAPVSGKDLGIMQFGFKNVVLSTRYGTEASIMSDGEPNLIVFGLSYQYEHPNGGMNGTDIILPGTRYSNVFYDKTEDKFYTWEDQKNAEKK